MVDKKKLNKKDFIFDRKNGETLVKNPGQIFGQQFVIMNVSNCKIYLMDHIADISVDDSNDCEIFVGPVASTLFIRDCKNLRISGAAKQVRISDCSNIDANIYSNTEPAFENCKDIRIGPYNFWYPHQNEHFEAAGLDPTADKWSQVFDFNHVPENPNWRLTKPEEYSGPHRKEVDDDSTQPENPVRVPTVYGGDLDIEIVVGSPEQTHQGPKVDGSLMQFDIKTGQQQALEHFEKQEQEQEYHEKQQSSPVKAHTNDFDDYFGGGESYHQQSTVQNNQNESFNQHSFDQKGFGQQSFDQKGFGQQSFDQKESIQHSFDQQGFNQQGFGQQSFDQQGYGQQSNIDPEEEERLLRLKRIEDDRIRTLQQKMAQEREDKDARRAKANQDLNRWASDRNSTLKARKEHNFQMQHDKKEAGKTSQYKNSWDKIVSNIDIKESDYKGKKDINRFKQALINKRSDVQGGGNF